MEEYEQCLEKAKKRKDLKLCPRGYCTAKQKFEVYPSAYANGYASQVCNGTQPDFEKMLRNDSGEKQILSGNEDTNSLKRWYDEKWVNVCEKGKGPNGYAVCGSGQGIDKPNKYPYCRAFYKLPGTDVVTVEELIKYYPDEYEDILNQMCEVKRSKQQGIDGKPTRVKLPSKIVKYVKKKRMEEQKSSSKKRSPKKVSAKKSKSNKRSPKKVSAKKSKSKKRSPKKGGKKISGILIPNNVKKEANLGLLLKQKGYAGGIDTGINRAKQLSQQKYIDVDTLATMRAWFARHGPDAKNGGTSYPGYIKWRRDGSPTDKGKNNYRGAVAWLIWGGDAAYKWLKSDEIRRILKSEFPNRKEANKKINLVKKY